jgi:signal peptidase I
MKKYHDLLTEKPKQFINSYLYRLYAYDGDDIYDKAIIYHADSRDSPEVQLKKKKSHDKVNKHIENNINIRNYIYRTISKFIKSTPHQTEEDLLKLKDNWHTNISLPIIDIYRKLYANQEIDIEIEKIRVGYLTIEDLCYCFPGDYYYLICRYIPKVTEKINFRPHGEVKIGLNELKVINKSIRNQLPKSLPLRFKNASIDELVDLIFTKENQKRLFTAEKT